MKLLNFGSLNYDYVYSVPHIIQEGETLLANGLEQFCGGKGLNQSIALARAGIQVCHAGKVGTDGARLRKLCEENGIDNRFILTGSDKTGHTMIQVDRDGQNCILLYGGCNRSLTKEDIDSVLKNFEMGDFILLQNEVNLIDYIIDRAYEKGMIIVLNPSPFDAQLNQCDLGKVSYFLLNEVEGLQMTGCSKPEEILDSMQKKYPNAKTVLTLGKLGVQYRDGEQSLSHDAYPVSVVDTTAAGDTFTGYFIASILRSEPVSEALRLASIASSISVTRKGATVSIPFMKEVREAIPKFEKLPQ